MNTRNESITFVKKVEPREEPSQEIVTLEMPETTRRRIIAILNAYVTGKMPKFSNVEFNDEKFKDVLEHAENVLAKMPETTEVSEDTDARRLAFAYRNIYSKLPHNEKDWDPGNKSDDEVVAMLIKRFGLPNDQ